MKTWKTIKVWKDEVVYDSRRVADSIESISVWKNDAGLPCADVVLAAGDENPRRRVRLYNIDGATAYEVEVEKKEAVISSKPLVGADDRPF